MKGFLNQNKQQKLSYDFKILKNEKQKKQEDNLTNEYQKQDKRSKEWQAYVNILKNEYQKPSEEIHKKFI